MEKVRVYEDLADFEVAVRPYLEAHEVENSLMLGLASILQVRPPGKPMFMAEVVSDDRTRLVGFYTGHLLTLSLGDTDALDDLFPALLESGIEYPGVVGPCELADEFAERWTAIKGGSIRASTRQRIYELRSVTPPTGVSGSFRLATMEDMDTLMTMYEEFHREAIPEAPFDVETSRRNLIARIESGWSYLWEDGGEATSLVGIGRPTRHGFSVGPVFTPVRFRNRGYASALVAAASQDILNMGKEFAVLYTDLSNPTSNSIYQKIGYRPVSDSANHWF